MQRMFWGKARGAFGVFVALILRADSKSAYSFGITTGIKEWHQLRKEPKQPFLGWVKWCTKNAYPRYTFTIFPFVLRYQKLDLRIDIDNRNTSKEEYQEMTSWEQTNSSVNVSQS